MMPKSRKGAKRQLAGARCEKLAPSAFQPASRTPVHLYHTVDRCLAPIFGHCADCLKRLGGKELAGGQTAV
jgi:hypothetical protein